jgi:hypothetical protein
MRLDKLRGYGPWFAFASPGFFFLAVLAIILTLSNITFGTNAPTPSWFGPAVAVWFLLLALWMVTGLVVALDLEWIEHPLTHTAMTYVGLAGAAISTLAFLGVLFESLLPISGNNLVVVATGFLFVAGLGVYLVVMNLVGWRARLLGRVLPWIGIVAGVLFLIAALMIVVGLGAGVSLPIVPAIPLYLLWSLWLGFRLRGKAPTPAAA